MCKFTVSIILPIYNAERHLKECLESCVHQTLDKTEIICINDGSTDDTDKILNIYAQNYGNIVILEQKNQGAGSARNLGIKHARGKYIAFMDSDDYYPDNDVLKKLYNTAVQEDVLICGGTLYFSQIGDSGLKNSKVKFQFKKNQKMYYRNYQHPYGFTQYIYNTEFLKKNEIVFSICRQYEDPPFLVKAMIKAQIFYAISDVVYVVRNTDKVIRYANKDIILGVLEGIKYILNISKVNEYEILHADVVVKMKTYLEYVYQLIYNGNSDVRKVYEDILYGIDETLLKRDKRQIEKPEVLSDKEIYQMVYRGLIREKELIQKIILFKIVLIYGAGRAGRSLYDYLKRRNYNGTVEFVVSAENPEYTACGKTVRCINDYVDYGNDVLVIIANKDHIKEMEENAKRHKFRNIEKISYDELKLFGADITFDNYITIY